MFFLSTTRHNDWMVKIKSPRDETQIILGSTFTHFYMNMNADAQKEAKFGEVNMIQRPLKERERKGRRVSQRSHGSE